MLVLYSTQQQAQLRACGICSLLLLIPGFIYSSISPLGLRAVSGCFVLIFFLPKVVYGYITHIIQSLQDILKTNIITTLLLNIEASLFFSKNHNDTATCMSKLGCAFFSVASRSNGHRLSVAF